MTEQSAVIALAGLDALQRTAWLDAGCRALETARARPILDDPFAQWIIATYGQAPGYEGLHPSLRLGVIARTWRFDDAISRQLDRARRSGSSIELWSLGAGFDARRLRLAHAFDGVLSAYREFDLKPVLDAKGTLIQASPFAGAYGALDFVSVDRPENLPAALPQSKTPVLVVAEGLVDFLPLAVRLNLLERLKSSAPHSVLLVDALSRAGTDYDNRQPQRFTGDKNLRMEPAPDDPSLLHAEAGWVTIDRSSLFSAMRDVLVTRHPRMLAPFRKVSPPSSMRHLYEFHALEPGGVALDRTDGGAG
jgi:O-methyltransferase involved in polyketide biosynthesis